MNMVRNYLYAPWGVFLVKISIQLPKGLLMVNKNGWYISADGEGLSHGQAKVREFIILCGVGSLLTSVVGCVVIKFAMVVCS